MCVSGIKENEAQTTVAIKTLNPYSNKDVLKSLMSELKIMSHLGQHPNIVNLLGAITTNIQRSELCITLVKTSAMTSFRYSIKEIKASLS